MVFVKITSLFKQKTSKIVISLLIWYQLLMIQLILDQNNCIKNIVSYEVAVKF